MKRLSKITLQPVISFNPFYFNINEPYPVRVREVERHNHWKKQMEKINLPDLIPIKTGYDFVATNQLSKESLIRVLDLVGMLEIDEEQSDKDYCNFTGGVTMKGDDQFIYISQCCISFDDYREWLEVKRTKHFHRVYIGHPWIYTHCKEDDIIFSGLIDDNFGNRDWEFRTIGDLPRGWGWGGWLKELDQAGIKKLMCQYVVDYEVFQKAQDRLKMEVDLFYNRVVEAIDSHGIKNAKSIADKYLIGSDGPTSYDRNAPLPVLPFEGYE